MQINAKVIKILFDKFTVDLSCKSSDLNTTGLSKDLYYDSEAADKVKQAKSAKKNKKIKVNRKFNSNRCGLLNILALQRLTYNLLNLKIY